MGLGQEARRGAPARPSAAAAPAHRRPLALAHPPAARAPPNASAKRCCSSRPTRPAPPHGGHHNRAPRQGRSPGVPWAWLARSSSPMSSSSSSMYGFNRRSTSSSYNTCQAPRNRLQVEPKPYTLSPAASGRCGAANRTPQAGPGSGAQRRARLAFPVLYEVHAVPHLPLPHQHVPRPAPGSRACGRSWVSRTAHGQTAASTLTGRFLGHSTQQRAVGRRRCGRFCGRSALECDLLGIRLEQLPQRQPVHSAHDLLLRDLQSAPTAAALVQ